MKTGGRILRIVAFVPFLIGAVAIAWPFVLPGICLWYFSKTDYPRWTAGFTALALALAFRGIRGDWMLNFGEYAAGDAMAESLHLLPNWALGSLFLAMGYQIPSLFLEGYRERVIS